MIDYGTVDPSVISDFVAFIALQARLRSDWWEESTHCSIFRRLGPSGAALVPVIGNYIDRIREGGELKNGYLFWGLAGHGEAGLDVLINALVRYSRGSLDMSHDEDSDDLRKLQDAIASFGETAIIKLSRHMPPFRMNKKRMNDRDVSSMSFVFHLVQNPSPYPKARD